MQQHPLLSLAFEDSVKNNHFRQHNESNEEKDFHPADDESQSIENIEKVDLNYLDSALFSLNSAIRDTKVKYFLYICFFF